MSNLLADPEAFKASCSVVFQAPDGQDVYLCGICSALIIQGDNGQKFFSHWNWHYTHWQILQLYPVHHHSIVTGEVNELAGSPDIVNIFRTFG